MKISRCFAYLFLSISLLLTACVREMWPDGSGENDECMIPFTTASSSDVIVSTKGTMTDQNAEKNVYNLYILVFDSEATDSENPEIRTPKNKVFGHFFDDSNRFNDKEAAIAAGYEHKNYWIRTGTGTGTIHLKSSKSSAEQSKSCTIVAIANLNSEMVNITPEQLGLITDWSEMQKLSAKLLQKITSRSGYFPMSGKISGVDLSGSTFSVPTTTKIELERLDARIEFQVHAATDKGIYDFTPLTWQVINIPVYGSALPEGSVGNVDDDLYFDSEAINFETTKLGEGNGNYEKYTGETNAREIPTHGFSFYMMENKKTSDPKKNPVDDEGNPRAWTYNDRDVAEKLPDGKTNRDTKGKPVFEYANDSATYVILKGQLAIKDQDGYLNHAEVTYIIHLGNFSTTDGSFDNFDVLRNHKYIYKVTIEGINMIRAEVMTDTHPEDNPGASGNIAVPVKKYFECDSHYTTHSMEFKLSDIVDNEGKLKPLGWWIRTPFNQDGAPSNADGSLPSSANIDYKWVEFRVNVDQVTAGTGSSFTYKDNVWTTYQPHGTDATLHTDVVQRNQYKYVVNPSDESNPYKHPVTGEGISPTMYIDELMDFLAAAAGKVSEVTLPKNAFDDNDRIVVTAFINEFYYEKDPLDESAGYQPALWKQFVNQPIRTMCILSSIDQHSPDGDSWVEKAMYIIQQHSIQSVYNVNSPDLNSGWGVEYLDDAREKSIYRAKGNDAQKAYSPNPSTATNAEKYRKNSNPDNGRWDTMIEWGLRTSSSATYDNSKSWSTFLNLTDDKDDISYMNNDYKYIRYTCMSRNRDNNGNGVIDKDEVRWYLAASNQLINLFLGSYGIESAAGLYQRTPEDRADTDPYHWRQHVVAGNCEEGNNVNSNDRCRIVWAEEGLTGSVLNKVGTQSNALVTARCARNFGYDPNSTTQDPAHGGDITYSSEDAAPDYLIDVKCYDERTGELYADGWSDSNKYKYAYFEIDCSRVNEKSLRYYTDRELAPHDEFEEASCLYKRFRTTSIEGSESWTTSIHSKTMNQAINNADVNVYCPVGYRLPNIRELGILCYFLPSSSVSQKFITGKGSFTFARTKWSFGNEGSQAKPSVDKDDAYTKWGFAIGTDGNYKALVANYSGDKHKTTSIRCVKDVKQ